MYACVCVCVCKRACICVCVWVNGTVISHVKSYTTVSYVHDCSHTIYMYFYFLHSPQSVLPLSSAGSSCDIDSFRSLPELSSPFFRLSLPHPSRYLANVSCLPLAETLGHFITEAKAQETRQLPQPFLCDFIVKRFLLFLCFLWPVAKKPKQRKV